MIELERIGNEVYCKGVKLKINPQASKGPGNEVINIEGLEGNPGKKWLSLSLLKEGLNTFSDDKLQPKQVTNHQKYSLTTEEQAEVDKLQAQIDAIIAKAKERYVPKKTKVQDMSIEELEAFLAQKKAEQKALELAELKKGKLN